MIGVGVHIIYIRYIGMFVEQKMYLSYRITFSNIRDETSSPMYGLALYRCFLQKRFPCRFFLYNAHFALFVRMDDTITHTDASVRIIISKMHYSGVALCRPDKQNRCKLGNNMNEYEELHFRRGSPLA